MIWNVCNGKLSYVLHALLVFPLISQYCSVWRSSASYISSDGKLRVILVINVWFQSWQSEFSISVKSCMSGFSENDLRLGNIANVCHDFLLFFCNHILQSLYKILLMTFWRVEMMTFFCRTCRRKSRLYFKTGKIWDFSLLLPSTSQFVDQ